MFVHNLKYSLKGIVRQKDFIFWILAFPIILGTFFYVAFSGMYENESIFREIPVAIVENTENTAFKEVMTKLSSGENPMFDSTYTDSVSALDMLQKNDISGIIYVNQELSLTVSHDGMKETIIKSFLDQYKIRETIIRDTINSNPQNLQFVINAMTQEINCNENILLSDGNMDFYIQYFYNLIAMAAFFGSITGLYISINNQGNLSAIAARKCVSPTNKLISLTANLLASFIAQVVCVSISVTYIVFILKVDMGNKIPMVYLSGAAGSLTGVTMGFFIGSFGRINQGVKTAISMTITMSSCFLSGLMVGNMKAVVEQYAPIVNRINPAALISDLFYCLNVYDDYKRYIEKFVTLMILSAIFTIGGFLLTRRKKYASL